MLPQVSITADRMGIGPDRQGCGCPRMSGQARTLVWDVTVKDRLRWLVEEMMEGPATSAAELALNYPRELAEDPEIRALRNVPAEWPHASRRDA